MKNDKGSCGGEEQARVRGCSPFSFGLVTVGRRTGHSAAAEEEL